MLKPTIAVATDQFSLIEKSKKLAHDLNLDFVFGWEEKIIKRYEFLLVVTDNYLALKKTDDKRNKSPFYIDFLSKDIKRRYKQKGLRSELLARAIGIHPREKPYVVDATAGLGRDSFMLAALGYEVTMLEISPIIYWLLKDALTRASNDEIFSPIIERMHLIHADSISWLKENAIKSAQYPDVIYLDPMFPSRKKSAAVKKQMVILQEFLRKCEDNAINLVELSLSCAKRRVVIKRPRLAAHLQDLPPDFSIKGKSSRFDVYIKK